MCCSIDDLTRVLSVPEFICPFMYFLKKISILSITFVVGALQLYYYLHIYVCAPSPPGLFADPRVHLRLESCVNEFSLKRLCLVILLVERAIQRTSKSPSPIFFNGFVWISSFPPQRRCCEFLMSWQNKQTSSRWGF